MNAADAETGPHPCRGLLQEAGRNVDRTYSRGVSSAPSTISVFIPAPAPYSRARHSSAKRRDFGAFHQNRRFGPRRIIFVELGDSFEEFAAAIIVEPTAWQTSSASWPSPARHFGTEGIRRGAFLHRRRQASRILRQPQARKLPARVWREEIAIGRADVTRRRNAGASAQHELAAHEFAIVFADRAFGRAEARIG